MNYDKANDIRVNKVVGDMFTNKELKTVARIMMLNALINEGLTVDEHTEVHTTVLSSNVGYNLQTRATRG